MKNYTTTARIGETGFTITTPLIDEDGPVDLTGWISVIMNVTDNKGQAVITSQPCAFSDALNGVITTSLDITVSAIPKIKAGRFRIHFVATDPAGHLHSFPKSDAHPYGILNVLA